MKLKEMLMGLEIPEKVYALINFDTLSFLDYNVIDVKVVSNEKKDSIEFLLIYDGYHYYSIEIGEMVFDESEKLIIPNSDFKIKETGEEKVVFHALKFKTIICDSIRVYFFDGAPSADNPFDELAFKEFFDSLNQNNHYMNTVRKRVKELSTHENLKDNLIELSIHYDLIYSLAKTINQSDESVKQSISSDPKLQEFVNYLMVFYNEREQYEL